jgi:hypothetical protein
MATAPKLVPIRSRPLAKGSPLTPELKDFIDRAIVPALVKKYLATQNELAESDARVSQSLSSTAAPRDGRP